jgi:hypothetical protein
MTKTTHRQNLGDVVELLTENSTSQLRPLGVFGLCLVLLGVSLRFPAMGLAQVTLDEILLKPTEVAPACKLIEARKPARKEAQIFYEHTVYSSILPVVFRKADQAFQCGKDKGVVYYFEYPDVTAREKAEEFARTSLWDATAHATPQRPEQIFNWDRFLIVVSFKWCRLNHCRRTCYGRCW